MPSEALLKAAIMYILDDGMKISMVVWNEFVNDARVLKEAETLQSNGYSVIVHALHTPGKTLVKEKLPSGVCVIRVARSPLWKWRKRKLTIGRPRRRGGANVDFNCIKRSTFSHSLLKIIARLWTHGALVIALFRSRPDVVHAHDVNTLPTAWAATVLTRSILVYDAHEVSTSREGYNNFRRLVGCVEKLLMPRAAAVITTTYTRAKFFARAYGIRRPLVLQNRPRYQIMTHRTPNLRLELGLSRNWPIVLYQGGLQQGRGLEILLDAALRVTNAYFVFIGGGRLEEVLKFRVHSLGLEDRVFFIPTVPLVELPNYTASADIGVQPIENTCLNHFSTDSNKLFEYMMAGLPIVATSMPEIRKLVKGYNMGLIVEPGDVSALASAIQALVDDVDMRVRMGNMALKASRHLSWEEQEEKLLALYRKIIATDTL